jgi:hypothetical protein
MDSRIAGLIPGVANHEARRVYDARVALLRQAHSAGDEAVLAAGLCDAIRLGLWRARSVTGYEALAHDVVGIEVARAWELAERDAARRALPLERMPDIAVAVWLRTESALLDTCPQGSVEVRVDGEQLRIGVTLPMAPPEVVADALAAVGRNAANLARVFQGDAPGVVPRRPPPRR